MYVVLRFQLVVHIQKEGHGCQTYTFHYRNELDANSHTAQKSGMLIALLSTV